MSGSKLQIALLAGVIVTAGMALQAGLPRLANDAGLLYLRAEYKLATGDTGSALELMQRAAIARQSEPSTAAVPSQPRSTCPYTAPKVTAPSETPHKRAGVIPARSPLPKTTHLRRVVVTIPAPVMVDHARVKAIEAQIQARQAEQDLRLKAAVAKLQAQLKSLPAMAVPGAPGASD